MADDSAVEPLPGQMLTMPNQAIIVMLLEQKVLGFTDTHYLKATNFGFSIDGSATINGITAEIEKYFSRSIVNGKDKYVQIVKADGSIGSTNKPESGVWYGTDTNSYSSHGVSF